MLFVSLSGSGSPLIDAGIGATWPFLTWSMAPGSPIGIAGVFSSYLKESATFLFSIARTLSFSLYRDSLMLRLSLWLEYLARQKQKQPESVKMIQSNQKMAIAPSSYLSFGSSSLLYTSLSHLGLAYNIFHSSGFLKDEPWRFLPVSLKHFE